jgi:coproporphyrinogen III oxidase-like Fe-S oxidoreductase
LLKEINAWQHCGGLLKRQVTTVHFGGGTPLFLGYDRFNTLVKALRSSFNITPRTEWALETTCRSLNTENLEGLTNLGFRRLHLGVQSMEPDVRPLLKRRETPYRILDKIKAARQLGWIVSVDLLVGLPAETLDGMLDGIEHLIHAGVDGFSIYEINISTQNMAFANQYKLLTRDRRENYWMFVAVVIFLLQQEYSKNLFNHFVNDRDQNLYFTFPLRSEDCLAMGAYADGVFEDYHYRHHDYLETIKTTSTYQPAIQGGIKRPPPMEKLYPIEIALLSGEIAEHQFKRAFSDVETQILLSRWRAALLIEENQSGTYSMTPNGAWFSGNIIQDLHRMAATHG